MTEWTVFRLETPVAERLRQLQKTWPNQPVQRPPTLSALVTLALDEMKAAPELRARVIALETKIARLQEIEGAHRCAAK